MDYLISILLGKIKSLSIPKLYIFLNNKNILYLMYFVIADLQGALPFLLKYTLVLKFDDMLVEMFS